MENAVPVNISNFIRAESDMYFQRYASNGAFGKFVHDRKGVDIDHQPIIRVNRDTPYSTGIFDLTVPVTIHKPDTGSRFQSMIVINEDHYIKLITYDAGEYTLTQEAMGTRYVVVLFRTLVDPSDPEDFQKIHAIMDQITATQESPGTLELPNWDSDSRDKLRAAILALGPFVSSSKGMFGDGDETEPVAHLIGTAAGWGGNPVEDALYLNVTPENQDGVTPYVLNITDVPVDGFWSISVYNRAGYFEKNPHDSYSLNQFTAQKSDDGSFTLRFGGDPTAPNFLNIMPGWNYCVRLYRPRREILSGQWKFPVPVPAG
jgi:hypothetical protein